MNYKDEVALREESEEGKRLGFDGKVSVILTNAFDAARENAC